MLIDWIERGLLTLLIPFTVLVAIIAIIERLPFALSGANRSWLWRGVFAKSVLLLLLPSAYYIPVLKIPPVESAQDEFAVAKMNISRDLAAKSDRLAVPAEPAVPASIATHEKMESLRLSVDSGVNEGLETKGASESLLQWMRGRVEAWRVWLHQWRLVWIPIWLIGFVGLLTMYWFEFVCMKAKLLSSAKRIDPNLLAMVSTTARKLGLKGQPRLRMSHEVDGPMLWMAARSELVLPADFEQRFGREACEMAIAHELAHYHRCDLYWNMVVIGFTSAFFFWPPAWFAARRYFVAMEMACDQFAIHRAKLNLAEYARLLVRLLEPSRNRAVTTVSLSMVKSGPFRSLAERLSSMKIESRTRRFMRPIATVVTCIAVVSMLVPWGIADDKGKKKSNSSSRANGSSNASSKSSGNTDAYGYPQQTQNKESSSNVVSGFASGSAFGSGNASGSGNSFGGGGGTGSMASPEGFSGFGGASSGGMAGASGGGSVSAGVSIGGPPKQESSGYPYNRPNNGSTSMNSGRAFASQSGSDGTSVSRTREERDGEVVTETTVKTKVNEVVIRESDEQGISVRIREYRKGKNRDKVSEYTADSREELKKEHPEAYKWVQRYADDNQNVFVGDKNQASAVMNGGMGKAMAGGGASGFAGGNGGGNAFGGGDAANQSQRAMESQIEEMISNAGDNPLMQQQLREMLNRIRSQRP